MYNILYMKGDYIMKTILRFIASSLFLALMVVIGNVTISYAEDTNTNTTTEVEETAATQQVSAEQTNTLANAEVKNGWTYDDDKGDYLYYQNNKLFTGWITENEGQEKGRYYVENGEKVVGTFKTIGNDRYYFDDNGNVSTGLFTEWDDSNNTDITYFADADGKLFKEGFKTVGNNKYYFENYAAVTNQRKLINGKYYFFKDDGTLLTGNWAYIDDRDIKVLADSNGVLVNGWYEITVYDNVKNWNYFENGFAVTEGTRTIDGSTYKFDWSGLVKGSYLTEIEGTDDYTDNQTSRTGSLLTGLQLVDGRYEYYNNDHTKLKTGWKKVNGYWYYFENYYAVTDDYNMEINGKYYTFGSDGKMKTGWIKTPYSTGAIWYYAESSGAHITGKFTTINGVRYAFDNNGHWCHNDVYNIGDKIYAFDKNGKMITGWYQTFYGYWYYLDKQGIAQKGWQTISGKRYYFDTNNGYMYTGSHKLSDNKISIFDSNGVLVEIKKQGWLEVDGNWYFIDKNLQPVVGEKYIKGHNYFFENYSDQFGDWLMYAEMYADTVLTTSDNDEISLTYYDENGYRVDKITAGWHLFGGEWYYFDGDNKPHDGLLQYNGSTYYIDEGKMLYDTYQTVDEKNNITYMFDKNGKQVKSGWYYQEINDTWYYADGTKNGALANGWTTIGGTEYYFDQIYYEMTNDNYLYINDDKYAFDKNGKIIKNNWYKTYFNWLYLGKDGKAYEERWLLYNGKWYYFDGNGYMVTGYYDIWNENTNTYTIYKFDENGALMTGWEKIDNKWYYFDNNSNFAVGWKKIGNTWYYFNDFGKMMTGWQLINGKYYYFENNGAMAANKWVGNYYLQADGSMAKNTWIGKYHVNASGKWDQTK